MKYFLIFLLVTGSIISCSKDDNSEVESIFTLYPSQNASEDLTNLGVENLDIFMTFDSENSRGLNPVTNMGEELILPHQFGIDNEYGKDTGISFTLNGNNDFSLSIDGEPLVNNNSLSFGPGYFTQSGKSIQVAGNGNYILSEEILFNSTKSGVHEFSILLETTNNTSVEVRYRIVVN